MKQQYQGLRIESSEDYRTLAMIYRTEMVVVNPIQYGPGVDIDVVKLGATVAVSRQMRESMKPELLDEYVHESLAHALDQQIEQMHEAARAYAEACGDPEPRGFYTKDAEGDWQMKYPMRRIKLEPPYYTPVPTEDGKTMLMTQEEISAYINGKLAGYIKPGSFRVTPDHLAWCSSLVGFEQPCNCKQEGE